MRLGQLFVNSGLVKHALTEAKPSQDWSKPRDWQAAGAKAQQDFGIPTAAPKGFVPGEAKYTPWAQTPAGQQFYSKWNNTRAEMRQQGEQNAREMGQLHGRLDQISGAIDSGLANRVAGKGWAPQPLGESDYTRGMGDAAVAKYRTDRQARADAMNMDKIERRFSNEGATFAASTPASREASTDFVGRTLPERRGVVQPAAPKTPTPSQHSYDLSRGYGVDPRWMNSVGRQARPEVFGPQWRQHTQRDLPEQKWLWGVNQSQDDKAVEEQALAEYYRSLGLPQ